MRILLLSDEADKALWDHLDRRLLEGVELILSCGDLPASYLSFLTCFTDAPILYIHGNHDERYAQKPPEGCICIEDAIYNFNGLRIMGLGGSMKYRPGAHMYNEHDMQKRVRKMAFKLWRNKGFDILLTHAPAFELGDQEDLPHRGFKVFVNLLDRYKPRYMVHGHVHPEYGIGFKRERRYNDTIIINAHKRYFIDI